MKTEFHFRGVKPDSASRRQFEADLAGVTRSVPVDGIEIVLEHQPETTPAYQAIARLAVAGSDIQVAARDHALPSAWQKLLARLRQEIETRRGPPSPWQRKHPA